MTENGNASRWQKAYWNVGWGTSQWVRRLTLRRPAAATNGLTHVILAVSDHFEPAHNADDPSQPPGVDIQLERVERWVREYARAVEPWRDADGRTFRHTYFYPAEQYERDVVERLAAHCHAGWGEIEVHLHHGMSAPDTSAETRRALLTFRDQLVALGCLSRWDGEGPAQYAFVHGNWALANSGDGHYCGVDDEVRILADTGCYADFTMPSAPHPTQIRKINSMYECALPLDLRAPHRRGRDLRVGRPPTTFPLMIQGPLALEFSTSSGWLPRPKIENGEMARLQVPTMRRFSLWRDQRIGVDGRPDWVFVKLHCHGMNPYDTDSLHGPGMRRFLEELSGGAAERGEAIHFVSAREMTNIALAACDGRTGSPGDYRDYRLRAITPHP